jgi:hypothetical protein
MADLLKCTVFNAATSHPSDCNTKVAIVLPTYLMTMSKYCCPKLGIIAIDNSPINHLHVSQQGSLRCGLERRNPTWLAIAKTRVSGIGKSVDMAK